MGLSKDERYSGVIHAVNSLTKLGEGTPAEKFTSKLWHALLGHVNNSSHWILGSSTYGSVKINGASVWERAICCHTEEVLEDKMEDDNVFDATERFSIQELVGYGSREQEPANEKMFEVYQWTEQTIYYLRRYDDDMPKEFCDLNKLISDIQGACFDFFKEDEIFAKAYIVNKIIKTNFKKM